MLGLCCLMQKLIFPPPCTTDVSEAPKMLMSYPCTSPGPRSRCPVWLMCNSSTSPTAAPNGKTQEFLSVSPAIVIEIWGLSPEISQKVFTIPPSQSSILANPRRSQEENGKSDALIGPMLFDSMMPGPWLLSALPWGVHQLELNLHVPPKLLSYSSKWW